MYHWLHFLIFWVSASHFYHASAWLKLFTLQKDYNKNLMQKDFAAIIASSVVLAALSVSPYDRLHDATHLEFENEKELNLRMISLIGFNIEAKCESREWVITVINIHEILINNLSDNKSHGHCFSWNGDVITKLQNFGYTCSDVTYGTIVDGLCKIGNIDQAIKLLKDMEKGNRKPNILMYIAIIDGLCKDEQITKAQNLFKEMICNFLFCIIRQLMLK
ncbi:hypothetical protein GIB67_003485 [Kingdonia uniflora]|uniref:eIF3a PCI domain-containing protein n=1 Tax=Kingdonia uniflora TaxID=39325 RepID=A0A7J7MEH3_9MAGN|nr:hypothetical protein GIB67_003485 [Kingdonia uniflora]